MPEICIILFEGIEFWATVLRRLFKNSMMFFLPRLVQSIWNYVISEVVELPFLVIRQPLDSLFRWVLLDEWSVLLRHMSRMSTQSIAQRNIKKALVALLVRVHRHCRTSPRSAPSSSRRFGEWSTPAWSELASRCCFGKPKTFLKKPFSQDIRPAALSTQFVLHMLTSPYSNLLTTSA